MAALSGHAKDAAVLKSDEVRALAPRASELVTCGAVATDSDAPCQLLTTDSQIKDCRAMRSIFHELRTYPNGRSFMFDDVKLEECHADPRVASICDNFRKALRSGDASQCSAAGELQGVCRAFIKLDKSLCSAQGKDSKEIVEDCKNTIDRKGFYAKGLKDLAESAPARERTLAKAALGQADACDSYMQAGTDTCVGMEATPAAGGPPPTPLPIAPSPSPLPLTPSPAMMVSPPPGALPPPMPAQG